MHTGGGQRRLHIPQLSLQLRRRLPQPGVTDPVERRPQAQQPAPPARRWAAVAGRYQRPKVATWLLKGHGIITRVSSREFNQDTTGAKKAAARGPVYITDRGRPAHVLLTYDDYERLLGTERVLDRLAEPAGVEDIELSPPTSDELARPAEFS